MSRRTALALGLLLATTSQLRPAAAVAPDPELPRVVCTHRVIDTKGDAVPQYFGTTLQPAVGNKPALDILGVDLRLTADQLQVFLAIDRIPDTSGMAAYEASYRYIVSFKLLGKTFTYGNELRNPSQPGQPLDGSSYPVMNMGTGGNDLPGSTAVIRPGTAPAPSWLIFTSPRDKIEKNLGNTPITAGDTFTDIYALTQVWTSQQSGKGDETSVPAAKAKYTVGDDYCFGPPPTSITTLTTPKLQWSDSSALSAVLLDEDGKPFPGKQLDFSVDDGKTGVMSATTDASGIAVVHYGNLAVPAGSYPVSVRFAGDTAGGTSSSAGTIEVTPEVSAFLPLVVTKPTATTRLVTARLLDDDKNPLVGVKLDWWVNGKRVASGVTDKTGRVILRTAKPGQTVQAKTVGVAGMVLGSASKLIKA